MNRRQFLAASASGMAAMMASAKTSPAGGPPDKPNVIVILADDLGWADLRCYGAQDMETPAVDRLAAEGMKFDDFHANCPVCSPTRAALLTGRYPELVGVPGVIRTDPRDSWGNLIPQAVMLPELLRRAGYHTALVGKWHLGLQSPSLPNERGFDHFHGFLGDMMDNYVTHRRHGQNYMRLNAEVIDPPGHATDLFTDWACDYLKNRPADRPFFLYLAYNAPHSPIQPPPEALAAVAKRRPDLPPRRAALVALIEHMDSGIGRVLQTLDRLDLARNTLVIFTSDNGGQLDLGAHNGPVRAGKGTVYEGGLRVPMLARWPGRIKPASRSGLLALTMDLMPTVMEACGLRVEHEIDGRSFLPTLLGENQPWPPRDLFFGRREGGPFKGGTIEAIRRGDWKLLRSRPGGPWELYNLADDPMEKNDLSAQQPARVAELAAALEAQLKRYAQVPWEPPGRGSQEPSTRPGSA